MISPLLENTPLLDVLTPRIGMLYHLKWAKSRGMQWRLLEINGTYCTMITPRTRKKLTAKVSDLQYTRKNQLKVLQGTITQ